LKKVQLVLSDLAVADILEQADWYIAKSGKPLAKRWDKAVTATVLRALRNPATGKICSFKAPELRDVRSMPIGGFSKHLLFYQVQRAKLVVLRVVHAARDLEALF
jgi:toxin ParE1/3/4